MNKRLLSLLLVFVISISAYVRADEGMWIPLLMAEQNYEDMKKNGLKLTAEDIYSVNQACLKDAVVIFGGGCTGEVISDEGLLITNHHCGYGAIQKHSSLENDYLTDGFWAMDRSQELPNKGLTVTFLVRMEDVTSKVLASVQEGDDEARRQRMIKEAIDKLEKETVEGTNYKAKIKPFYYGNEFYMFVTEVFTDIRMVGAPPSAIGKFGGDTDNWMWPRHTGDFSLFRIYADKDNNPAEYSADNVPYKPKKHLPISLNGVKEGDFTMVYGYPGTTQQYLTSYAVEMITKTSNPHKIALRQKKLDILKVDMDASDKVRIQYSSKYAGVANAWKKWIGENKGLRKLHALDKKKELEANFNEWANLTEDNKAKYGNLLLQFENIYKGLAPYELAVDYIYESVFAIEIIKNASKFSELERLIAIEDGEEDVKAFIERYKNASSSIYKDYNQPTDKKIFAELLKMYYNNLDAEFQPETFRMIEKKFKGDFNKYAEYVYSKSIFANEANLNLFLNEYGKSSLKKLQKDPAYMLYSDVVGLYRTKLMAVTSDADNKISKLNRLYVAALREMQTDKLFYPDANFTLRVAYGKVDGYEPKDGVVYNYYTTLDGIIDKDNPEIYDYNVPTRLKELYKSSDFGQYGEDGEMHVCFIASNHTTGGNSGSPVINGEGQLIGVNFDRNWEGTMSDIMYDPNQCRNIVIDIRYALFIIDKFAGATHLIDEMTIVKDEPVKVIETVEEVMPVTE